LTIAGKEANKHDDKKNKAGRGPTGNTPVAGGKDSETNQVSTEATENIGSTDAPTMSHYLKVVMDGLTNAYSRKASGTKSSGAIPPVHPLLAEISLVSAM
jgi:hypothetical protein